MFIHITLCQSYQDENLILPEKERAKKAMGFFGTL
jgi:hypothetical protein